MQWHAVAGTASCTVPPQRPTSATRRRFGVHGPRFWYTVAVTLRSRTRRARRRNVLKVFGAILVFLALLGVAGVVTIRLLPLPEYSEVAAVDPGFKSTPARVERGAGLVAMTCAGCHASAEDQRLIGRALAELPKSWGEVAAPNLTVHKRAGLGAVGDAELVRAIRTGVDKDGKFMPPYMPRYSRMADEDLAAIVAFLRSDDPWVAADAAKPDDSKPSLGVKFKSLFTWRPAVASAEPIVRPSRNEPEALGAYLVEDLLQCNLCHGSRKDSLALAVPIQDPDYLGGGIEMTDFNGKPLFGANITFDEEAGIGRWTFDDFRRAMVDGARPDGTPVRWPMPRYAALDEVELAAIFSYLSNVPPVEDAVEPAAEYRIPGQKLDRGRHLFFKHACFGCHGDKTPHGVVFDAAAHFETDAMIVEFLRDPSATRPRIAMPAYGQRMDDEELLALAGYVRSMATALRNK